MRSGIEAPLMPGIISPDSTARNETPSSGISEIIYAGRSPKRGAFARFLGKTYGIPVFSIPGGAEFQQQNPVEIADGKIINAFSILQEQGRISPDSRTKRAFIAADVQIHSSALGKDGKTVIRTSGKPEDRYNIRGIFQGMATAARVTGDLRQYGYMIEAGSKSYITAGDQNFAAQPGLYYFYIALEKTAVDYFATEQGCQEYVSALTQFLRSPQYLSNGLKHPSAPEEVAGGLDITILKKLGAIHKINGVRRGEENFEEEFKTAFWAAHVGFHQDVLKLIDPNAQQLIDVWPWPSSVINYARGNPPQPYLM